MPLRSILALMSTVDVLEERGVDCAPVLARHGLEPERLDPNGEIERDRELAVLTELLPLAGDPLFGFEMGKRFGLAGYGPLTMLLMTSRTAFQGFQIGVRYQALTYLYGKLSLVPGEDTTKLILEPVPLPDSVRRILIDRDMTGTFNLVNEIQTQLGLNLAPLEVWLPFPEPAEATPTRLPSRSFKLLSFAPFGKTKCISSGYRLAMIRTLSFLSPLNLPVPSKP